MAHTCWSLCLAHRCFITYHFILHAGRPADHCLLSHLACRLSTIKCQHCCLSSNKYFPYFSRTTLPSERNLAQQQQNFLKLYSYLTQRELARHDLGAFFNKELKRMEKRRIIGENIAAWCR